MPAAGGLKKAELTIEPPIKRPPAIKGNPLGRFVTPFSPLIKALGYVALWKNPQLSAYTFIWLNLTIVLHIAFGLHTPLATTLTLLLLTTNLVLVEHSFTRTNISVVCLYSLLGISTSDLASLPGSEEFSQLLVNGVNSICNVFLNIRDSSEQGQAQFYFALCTTVAMITILLSYLASSTSLLITFWFLFCFPAIKHNQLHKKVSQEQIMSVCHMSLYMLYSVYQGILQAVTAEQPVTADGASHDLTDPTSLNFTEAGGASLRSTTMTYLRGLPSAMTLRWGSMWGRGRDGQPPAISPAVTESTESDSDFGIEDIEDDVREGRSRTVETLGSNAGLEFPSIDRKDTLDYEPGTGTLAGELDPMLLYDEDNTYTLDSMGAGPEFTLGGEQRLHLLDAVTESGDEEESDLEVDDAMMTSSLHSRDVIKSSPETRTRRDTLDGTQVLLAPAPPDQPKPTSGLRHRAKQTSQQSATSGCGSTTTDTEFYVISDEDIQAAAADELEESTVSSAGSSTSLREKITGRFKELSGGRSSPNPKI